jgi:hypothetical protein
MLATPIMVTGSLLKGIFRMYSLGLDVFKREVARSLQV